MAYELYQTLELMPGASTEEVKRGYYKLVRKYSPEKAPERFKLIREAYETLSDPTARQDYDALQQYGEEISMLSSEAEEEMTNERWGTAISIWKRILVLRPNANGARQMLGVCYVRQQDWDNALKVYRRLITEKPDEPSYYLHSGIIFQQYAVSLHADNPDRHQLFEKAREQFKRSVDLEPYNSQPYIEISRIYAEEREYDQALIWAERAISADGKTDFYDFDTLFYICLIHLWSGQLQKIDGVSQRIIALLPEGNEDIQRFVASRFADTGSDLSKYGYQNQNFEMLKAASSFFKTASSLDPSNEEIRRVQNLIDSSTQANDLLYLLNADSQIVEGFYRLALFCLTLYMNYEIEDKEGVFLEINNCIFESPPKAVLESVKRIKKQYQPIYKLNEKLFDSFGETAQEHLNGTSSNPSSYQIPQTTQSSQPSTTFTQATTLDQSQSFKGGQFVAGVLAILFSVLIGQWWFILFGLALIFTSCSS